jgi:predicted PhzF superfamily epimerase YddE/YHI9
MLEHGTLLEDPVTGSANARLQQPQSYRERQGTVLGRDGRISVTFEDGTPWIGGQCITVIDGTLMADCSQ